MVAVGHYASLSEKDHEELPQLGMFHVLGEDPPQKMMLIAL